MNRKFIYVTGPFEGLNEYAKKANITQLDLVCRRVIVAKHIPLCPILFYGAWMKDPRFYSQSAWWVDNIFKPIMLQCNYFCYIPPYAGVRNERLEYEKDIWKTLNRTRMIIADRLIKYFNEDVDNGHN
ncbi:MAG TPA: hypothetical protein PLS36_05755 [Clostridia bacterium]|nr:hypothetical protein [Clostridia bacterium]HXK71950.1 hypothetical protein [Clostridia bacterium]